jgi:MFS family permease
MKQQPNSHKSNRLPMRDLFLLLASTMTVMAGATLAPALPGMREAFSHQSNAELWVKLILAIPGLCIAVCAPAVGLLVDRWHKKNTLLIALLWCGVTGSIGYVLHDSLMIILISRIMLGIAVAGIMVTCVTLAGDYFSGTAFGRYMGLQAAFGSFGGVFFLASAGLLAEIDWTMPFLIYLLALLILPGCVFFLQEPVRKEKYNQEHERIIGDAKSLSKKMIILCYALATFEMLVLYLVPLHFPFFIQQLKNNVASTSLIGFSIAAMLLVSAIVSMNYRYYSHRFSLHGLQALGLTIAASGLLGLAVASNYGIALVGLIFMGVGIGIIRPNLIVWLFSFTPVAMRGRITGGITSCFFIGQILCPILTQPLITTLGYSILYALAGVITLLLGGLLLFVFSRNRTNTLVIHTTDQRVSSLPIQGDNPLITNKNSV